MEGCCEANLICGLLQQSTTDGENLARPVPEIHTRDADVQARPGSAVTADDEFTVVGSGGRVKRRAQSPLLGSQRAT
eukprot:1087600-Amphidinium_carterae.1